MVHVTHALRDKKCYDLPPHRNPARRQFVHEFFSMPSDRFHSKWIHLLLHDPLPIVSDGSDSFEYCVKCLSPVSQSCDPPPKDPESTTQCITQSVSLKIKLDLYARREYPGSGGAPNEAVSRRSWIYSIPGPATGLYEEFGEDLFGLNKLTDGDFHAKWVHTYMGIEPKDETPAPKQVAVRLSGLKLPPVSAEGQEQHQ